MTDFKAALYKEITEHQETKRKYNSLLDEYKELEEEIQDLKSRLKRLENVVWNRIERRG